jgi:hypothetical protein
MITLQKTDSNCSNAILIDQNLDLSPSLDIINYNIASLSASLNDLDRNLSDWQNFYSVFSQNSSTLLQTAINIHTIDSACTSQYTTVVSLSSTWNKGFSVFYPTILDVDKWYLQYGNGNYFFSKNNSQDLFLTSWLNSNFPPEDFIQNSYIDVFVTFSKTFDFQYNFSTSYVENCAPNAGNGGHAQCSGCSGTEQDDAQCNRSALIFGKWVHYCANGYTYCQYVDVPANVQGVCNDGIGARTLSVGPIVQNGSDTYVARVRQYRYININSSWQAQLFNLTTNNWNTL